MPKILYCLKCSKAVYEHSRGCRSKITLIYYWDSKGASCEPDDPDSHKEIYKAHELVDLHRKPYCSWEKDYSRLRRVYVRKYNPANWESVGWLCERCGNFIKI